MSNAQWKRVRLDECTQIVSGATPDTSDSGFWGGDICWATPKDLSELDGAFITDTPRKITQAGLDSCAATILPPMSVLFSSRAPIGHVAINKAPMATNQGFKSFVPDPKQLTPEFLYWWLRTNRSYLESLGNGATFKEVSKAVVARIEIPLPPLAEQRRIAEVLDRAEALRAKRRAALAHLDTLTQSLFLDLFGDPVANRKAFPISRMGDVCDVRDGTHDSPKYVAEGGYPLVTSKNLSGGFLDLSDVNRISEADYVQINKRSKVDRGDIIMPMIGTIGSPVLVEDEPRFAIKNVALIKFTDGSPSPIVVRHLLSCHYFDHIVGQKNRGGTQKFVSLGDLRAFPLPLAPLPLQREFARRVAAVEKLKAAQRVALAELDALFTSLQHRAFRAEL